MSDKNALQLWPVPRPKKRRKVAPPPRLYSRARMPVVDVHMHIGPNHHPNKDVVAATADFLTTMDRGGVTIAVNLSGSPEAVAQAERLEEISGGRVLICPGTYFRKNVREFWWSAKDIESFAQRPNIAGLKIWCRYQRPLLKRSIGRKLAKQAAVGIPAIGMHIADPPARGFWLPNYWECIVDAERVIRAHPGIDFIMAHGFWLMTDDEGLDVLGRYFDAYPNLHVDLSAAYQWWDGPEPTYDTLRRFIIRYKDRILYGTDGNPAYTTAQRYEQSYAILETRKKNLPPFFDAPHKTWQIHGLGLPNEVLNYIYYWNAARLIPNIRRSLLAQGYVV